MVYLNFQLVVQSSHEKFSLVLLQITNYIYGDMRYCLKYSGTRFLSTENYIDRFHCHATKKLIENRPVKEAKKMICHKRLIFKQFVQVSGLFGPQFLSYLPKRFTHLCRALYGDAILVHSFGAPIWPPKINKNIWSSLVL